MLVAMAFSWPVAPLSRSPARIASVGIPGGSLGDTGAAISAALRSRLAVKGLGCAPTMVLS